MSIYNEEAGAILRELARLRPDLSADTVRTFDDVEIAMREGAVHIYADSDPSGTLECLFVVTLEDVLGDQEIEGEYDTRADAIAHALRLVDEHDPRDPQPDPLAGLAWLADAIGGTYEHPDYVEKLLHDGWCMRVTLEEHDGEPKPWYACGLYRDNDGSPPVHMEDVATREEAVALAARWPTGHDKPAPPEPHCPTCTCRS